MDVLRLEVTPAGPDDWAFDFQVQVYVNDREMTAAGAGLGMDPYDVLVPHNRFVATTRPHRTAVARCGCGTYGCGSTDVTIVREAGVVHWDWLLEVPVDRRVTYSASAYDDEVARAGADFSWETPVRTAGRLILMTVDRPVLERMGLRVDWVQTYDDDPSLFRVALADETHQVFVDVPWLGRSPQELAAEAVRVLARQPAEWDASWSAMRGPDRPPRMAAATWRRVTF